MRPIIGLLLCLGLLSGAIAQDFKGVVYKTPSGWEEGTEGDAKVFAPKGLKDGEVLAVIMTGAVPVQGSNLEKQFTDTITIANDGGKVSSEGKVQKQEGNGLTFLLKNLVLDLAPIGSHTRLYAQVSQGEQRVFVIVIINKDALMEKYGSAVTDFIANLGFKTPVGKAVVRGKIPTGNTPDFYPGSVGWMPSGKGIPIPAPTLANGKPEGLWWRFTYDTTDNKTKSVIHIYLPDGTRASNPRFGGGMLYDLIGQRAQKGSTGVGTFTLSEGQMVEKYDGFVNQGAYSSGSDKGGKFFKIGGATFRPLIAATSSEILGQWKGASADYKFKADGTYEMGMTQANGDFAVVGFSTGTYVLDGYLIMLVPSNAPRYISIIGKAGDELIIGANFYSKR